MWKKWSEKKNAFALAIAWSISTAVCLIGLFRWYGITDRADGRILVLFVLSTIDAVLWWLRWYRLNDYKKQEENDNE